MTSQPLAETRARNDDIPAPTGFAESRDAWQEWLDNTTLDVRREADDATYWHLRQPENLIRWQRCLAVLDGDINARMGDARLRLEALRPEVGSPDRKAWHDAKREHNDKHARRVRFRNAIHERLKECRFRMDEAGLSERLTSETLLEAIQRAHNMLDRDDMEAASALLGSLIADAQKAVDSVA